MIVIEKIWIPLVMVYLIARFIKFFVVLRKEWHNGSQAKYEAKKTKIEARYIEHKLISGEKLTNKPIRRRL